MEDTPATPSGPALPPAAWYDDPTGRHQLRYWDGTRWSDHVSDNGQTSVDPVAGPGPAVAATTASSPATVETATGIQPSPVPTAAPPPSVPTASGVVLGPAAAWNAPVTPTGAPPMIRGIGGLAASLTVILWVTVAVAAFSVFAHVNRVIVVNDILDLDFGEADFGALEDLQQRADDADDFVGVATLLMFLCSVVIFVLLLVWMWRVAKNAQLTGRTNPRFGPGWTIGGWFIPLASLVIPVLVMQDLWRASSPDVPRGDPTWRSSRGSAVVGWWWAAFLLASLRFFSGGEADSRSELENLKTMDTAAAIGSVAAIAAAILLIAVVRGITRRQEALATGALAATPA